MTQQDAPKIGKEKPLAESKIPDSGSGGINVSITIYKRWDEYSSSYSRIKLLTQFVHLEISKTL